MGFGCAVCRQRRRKAACEHKWREVSVAIDWCELCGGLRHFHRATDAKPEVTYTYELPQGAS